MEERRKFLRLDINVTVKWSKIVEEKEAPENEDKTKNISAGGICLMVYERLQAGDRLRLDIILPTGNTIRTIGRVVWIKEFEIVGREDRKGFDAGIEFIKISDEEREELKRFVFNPHINK